MSTMPRTSMPPASCFFRRNSGVTNGPSRSILRKMRAGRMKTIRGEQVPPMMSSGASTYARRP